MELIDIRTGADPHQALESGNIVYFPNESSGLTDAAKRFLLSVRQANGAIHKNISYRPSQDKVSGYNGPADQLHSALRSYSQWAVQFTGNILPRYKLHWRLDYASFRPQEEQGRDLPWKKRNDLLHIDAFPSRPTQGDLILRVFTNINPDQKRVWVTSDPFAVLAPEYATKLPLRSRPWMRLLLPFAQRTPYDRFMLRFHDYLKANSEYQRDCAKYRFEFPPNSTWMVFTDVVPHAVLSGQYALEQTFIVARSSLANPALAPVSILEKISGTTLTN